jgi:hypothetical protein
VHLLLSVFSAHTDDYVINVNDCAGHFKSTDRNVCARTAVDTMRAVLTPGCDATTWSNFPRENVTSFDANSLAYSFDYGAWHFVVLQYSPRWVVRCVCVCVCLCVCVCVCVCARWWRRCLCAVPKSPVLHARTQH